MKTVTKTILSITLLVVLASILSGVFLQDESLWSVAAVIGAIATGCMTFLMGYEQGERMAPGAADAEKYSLAFLNSFFVPIFVVSVLVAGSAFQIARIVSLVVG